MPHATARAVMPPADPGLPVVLLLGWWHPDSAGPAGAHA
jgi:hypothetical protein